METIVHVENGEYLGQTRFAKDLLQESLLLSVREVRGVAMDSKRLLSAKNKVIRISRCKDSNHLIVDVNLTVLSGFAVSDVAYRVQEAILNAATQFTNEKIDRVNIYVRGAKYGASVKQK